MRILIKLLLHVITFTLLTAITQIGGVIYIISLFFFRKASSDNKRKRVLLYISLYLIATFIIVPNVAPFFGREKINNSDKIEAHTFFTVLANRNYVIPELNKTLQKIAKAIDKNHKGIKTVYLDANFPFIDKFPLPPHLSHNDGKKIDLAFIYEDDKGTVVNNKKAISGYGVFEAPKSNEFNQINYCKEKGKWQYDFTKYVSFGNINSHLKLSKKVTRDLILEIIKQPNVSKLFVEPHLKNRLSLNNNKIRFHGCQAVRHDDHIHFQIR